MLKIDSGDFFLVEPNETYAEQIREYRQELLNTGPSMDGCGSLRKIEDPIAYISECRRFTALDTLPDGLVIATQFLYVRKRMIVLSA